MEKKKSDIGHNSNLLIEDAFKETIKDAYKSSRKASDLALNMWLKLSCLFHRTAALTREQENWNFGADKHNRIMLQKNPNPATNKKWLRQKYKPRKLTSEEAYDLYKEMDRDFNKLFELSGDAAAYISGSEDPRLEEIVDEVDNEKK